MAEPESDMLPVWACNICLEESRNAVCTACGHLFCWSCLHPWVERNQPCPVCRAPITLGGIVPIYGSAEARQSEAGSSSLPPRPRPAVTRPPQAQRPRIPVVPVPDVLVAQSPRFREVTRGVEVERTEGREQIAFEEEEYDQSLNSFQRDEDNLSHMTQRLREMLATNTVALSGAQTPGASSSHSRVGSTARTQRAPAEWMQHMPGRSEGTSMHRL